MEPPPVFSSPTFPDVRFVLDTLAKLLPPHHTHAMTQQTLATTYVILHMMSGTAWGQEIPSSLPSIPSCQHMLDNALKLLTPQTMHHAQAGVALLHILGCEAEAKKLEEAIKERQKHDTDKTKPTRTPLTPAPPEGGVAHTVSL